MNLVGFARPRSSWVFEEEEENEDEDDGSWGEPQKISQWALSWGILRS